MSQRLVLFIVGVFAGALIAGAVVIHGLAPLTSTTEVDVSADPETVTGMLAAVLRRSESDLSTASGTDAEAARLTAATEQDPMGAFAEAAGRTNSMARSSAVLHVGRVWARTDPVAALGQGRTLPPALRARYEEVVTAEWANLDAAGFLTYAETTSDIAALMGGLELLTTIEPARVFELASQLPTDDPYGRNPIRIAALRALAEQDPAQALSTIDAIEDETGPLAFDQMMTDVMFRYAQADPDAALAWLDARRAPSISERSAVLMGVAAFDFERGYELALGMPDESELIAFALGRSFVTDPARASQAADRLVTDGGARAGHILNDLMDLWVSRDPERAVEWMIGRADVVDPQLARAIGQSLATRNLDAAVAQLDRLPSSIRDLWVTPVAMRYAQEDAAGAFEWINRYQGSAQFDTIYSQVVMSAADADPAFVAAMLGTVEPTLRAAAAPRIATAWIDRDPAAATAWVATLQDRLMAPAASEALAAQWARNDPEAATRWAMNLADGESRDAALGGVISRAYGTNIDPRPILDAIGSEKRRREATRLAIFRIRTTNAEVARELLGRLIDDPEYGEWARDTLGAMDASGP